MNKTTKAAIFILIAINILSVILYFGITGRRYKISKTNIAQNQTVQPAFKIIISMNKTVTQEFIDICSYQITPDQTLSLSSDGNSIIISPYSGYTPGESYTLELACSYLKYTVTFSTKNIESLTKSEEAEYQSCLDIAIADDFRKLLEEKPWIETFPIVTENYELTYDLESNQYLIYLLDSAPQKNKTILEEEIYKKIEEISAPDLSIVWRN